MDSKIPQQSATRFFKKNSLYGLGLQRHGGTAELQLWFVPNSIPRRFVHFVEFKAHDGVRKFHRKAIAVCAVSIRHGQTIWLLYTRLIIASSVSDVRNNLAFTGKVTVPNWAAALINFLYALWVVLFYSLVSLLGSHSINLAGNRNININSCRWLTKFAKPLQDNFFFSSVRFNWLVGCRRCIRKIKAKYCTLMKKATHFLREFDDFSSDAVVVKSM